MPFFLWLLLLGCESGGEVETTEVEVRSPDGRLRLAVTADEGRLSFAVRLDEVRVVEDSPLGLRSTTHDLTEGVVMYEGAARQVDETYEMIVGKRSERHVLANELVVPLAASNDRRAELILHAQDDGVAFRYRLLGEGETTVEDELTGFTVPEGSRALVRPYDDGREIAFIFTAGSYEQSPALVPAGTPTVASGFAFPALFELPNAQGYAMISEADLDEGYCGTRLHETPEGTRYGIRFPDEREGRGVGEVLPRAALPMQTPWRVVIAGDRLGTIVESTLVDDVSRSFLDVDTSWVRPGRAAWSWFSQETGTPLLQSEYIDFAEEHGWEYVLIDANWDRWEDPERVVRALVAEANAGGVRLFLWYNSGGDHASVQTETPIDRMVDRDTRRAEMEKIARWGIAGIKVDFFASDKQDRIAQYLGILRDAADFRLLVNFHGSTIPRGWQRAHPNLMTQEAVNGAELYKDDINVLGDRAPTASINLHHVLLRNVVGSMDYTPVTFEAALRVKGLPYAHSIALAVLFESGLQHFADRADSERTEGYRAVFEAYPFVGEFLSTVPITWDDTRLLSGDVDTHVVLARRKGEVWYVAGIQTADAPFEVVFTADFIESGRYAVEVIEQGATPDALVRRVDTVEAGDPVAVALPARSGFVRVFRPSE